MRCKLLPPKIAPQAKVTVLTLTLTFALYAALLKRLQTKSDGLKVL